MANYRCQIVSQVLVGDSTADFVSNTLWYSAPTSTPNAIGDAIKTALIAGTLPYAQYLAIDVKVYDHANVPHSPPVYTSHNAGSGTLTLGPRQVALCLSFYSGLNVRGQRGRIYIGPFALTDMHERASSTTLTAVQTLANALKHPGGADVVHQIHHKKTDTFSNVSNYFVNNRWDSMRSRLNKESSRLLA